MVATEPGRSPAWLGARLAWWGRSAAVLVLGISVLNWVGWATGTDTLTRIFASWPFMSPWSAVILAALAVAVLVALEPPTPARVWTLRALTAFVGVLAAVFLAERLTGMSLGLDQAFFSDALIVTGHSVSGPVSGRPSGWTAFSAVMLAVAVALTHHSRPWTRITWQVCLTAAAVLPSITALTYTFEAILLLDATRTGGQALESVVSLLLLVAATSIARPDQDLLTRLLARPDRRPLIRLVALMAALPIAMAISRSAFLKAGVHGEGVWILSITVGVVVVGTAVFFTSQREHKLLIEKETLSRQTAQAERERAEAESQRAEAERERAEAESQRADLERERAEAESRYRILADNAVDVVLHLRDGVVVWVSPSVQAAFGDPPEEWIGSDFLTHVHPDDVDTVVAAIREIDTEKAFVTPRYRVRTAEGGYHWVDGPGKPYIDADGNIDGTTGAMRIIDDQVEAEQKLQRLARFDTLTGLVNRAETFARLESGLTNKRSPGTQLGVLFCDIDKFKSINDTYGHDVGDAVLWTVADRISQCVRHGDTVGRTGGDEMLVLLPGLHSLDEAVRIANKIQARNAEPINHSGSSFYARLSIGVTLAIPGESVTDTTSRADAAMYQAKHAGGNTVSYV